MILQVELDNDGFVEEHVTMMNDDAASDIVATDHTAFPSLSVGSDQNPESISTLRQRAKDAETTVTGYVKLRFHQFSQKTDAQIQLVRLACPQAGCKQSCEVVQHEDNTVTFTCKSKHNVLEPEPLFWFAAEFIDEKELNASKNVVSVRVSDSAAQPLLGHDAAWFVDPENEEHEEAARTAIKKEAKVYKIVVQANQGLAPVISCSVE